MVDPGETDVLNESVAAQKISAVETPQLDPVPPAHRCERTPLWMVVADAMSE